MTESNKKTDAKDKIDCMETEEVPLVGSEEDSAVILRWMGWRNKVAAIIRLQVFLYWYVAIKSGCCWEYYWATRGCMHIHIAGFPCLVGRHWAALFLASCRPESYERLPAFLHEARLSH